MATVAPAERAPWHLWVVGVVSLLWNSFGCYDYLMSHLDAANYFKSLGFSAEAIAYLDGLPAWLTVFWALGVWGSLAGSLLLLLRSRHAVTAFAASFIGFVISQGYQFLLTKPPAEMTTPGMMVMPFVIGVSLLFFLWYANRMRGAGVLK